MKHPLTVENILSDIEFELIQGTISHNELGRSVQIVKKHHEKLRQEIFENTSKEMNFYEITSHQFQINEMLLRLLQESATTIRQLQWQFKRSETITPKAMEVSNVSPPIKNNTINTVDSYETQEQLSNWWPPLEIEEAMQSDVLHLELDSRPVHIPIIGGLLKRLRDMIHHLVLFYVNKIATKQGHINQTYGEWITHFVQLHQQQAEKIQQLEAQLSAQKKQSPQQ